MTCKLSLEIYSSPVVNNWGYLENWKSTAPNQKLL